MGNNYGYVVSNSRRDKDGKPYGLTRAMIDDRDGEFKGSFAKAIQHMMDDLFVARCHFVHIMLGQKDWNYVPAEQKGKEATWPGTVYVHTTFLLDQTIYMRAHCILDVQGHEITLDLNRLGLTDAAIECRTLTYADGDLYCQSVSFPEVNPDQSEYDNWNCVDLDEKMPDGSFVYQNTFAPRQIIARRGQFVNARFRVPYRRNPDKKYRGALVRITTNNNQGGNYHCIFKNIRCTWDGADSGFAPLFNGIELIGFPSQGGRRSAHDCTFQNIQMDAVNVGIYTGVRSKSFGCQVYPHCYDNGHLFQDIYFERCNKLVWLDRNILRLADDQPFPGRPFPLNPITPYFAANTFFNVRGMPFPGASVGVYSLGSGNHFKHSGPVNWLSESDSDEAREWIFHDDVLYAYVCTHPLEGDVEWGADGPEPYDGDPCNPPAQGRHVFVTPLRNTLGGNETCSASRYEDDDQRNIADFGPSLGAVSSGDASEEVEGLRLHPSQTYRTASSLDNPCVAFDPVDLEDMPSIDIPVVTIPEPEPGWDYSEWHVVGQSDLFMQSLDEALRDAPEKNLPPFDEPGGGKSGIIESSERVDLGALAGYVEG